MKILIFCANVKFFLQFKEQFVGVSGGDFRVDRGLRNYLFAKFQVYDAWSEHQDRQYKQIMKHLKLF